ncbi:MAG: hypothetical protein ACE14O_02495 [Candidatus Cloacimonadaceae bacterium]
MKTRRQIWLLVILAAFLLLLFGCEKGGNIRIFNRTSHPVYVGALGSVYTVDGDSTLTLDVDTPTSTPFTNDTGRWVELALQGETYEIWDDYEEEFVGKTDVWVETGKTTKVYLHPNRACIKIFNESHWYIKHIMIQRVTNFTFVTYEYDFLGNLIAPGQIWYKTMTPADSVNHYAYRGRVIFENDQYYDFGSDQNFLYTDDVMEVHIPPQEITKVCLAPYSDRKLRLLSEPKY